MILLVHSALCATLSSSRAPAGERICYPIPPVKSHPKRGQVLEGTSFGAALSATASLTDVKRILELGTWYGGGSTLSMARGIRASARQTLARTLNTSAPVDNCVVHQFDKCCHSLVVSIEIFKPAWEHAQGYLREWPVWVVRGSTVAAEEMLTIGDIPSAMRSRHFKQYYRRDLKLMRTSKPQLQHFCARYQFDLVLIDGNEYTGWAEFEHVRTECCPTYLALHDTQTLKTKKIEAYLAHHTDEYRIFLHKGATGSMRPACNLIGCEPEETFLPNKAGWSIYKRVSP